MTKPYMWWGKKKRKKNATAVVGPRSASFQKSDNGCEKTHMERAIQRWGPFLPCVSSRSDRLVDCLSRLQPIGILPTSPNHGHVLNSQESKSQTRKQLLLLCCGGREYSGATLWSKASSSLVYVVFNVSATALKQFSGRNVAHAASPGHTDFWFTGLGILFGKFAPEYSSSLTCVLPWVSNIINILVQIQHYTTTIPGTVFGVLQRGDGIWGRGSTQTEGLFIFQVYALLMFIVHTCIML